jgi:prephenate dehydrogenase
MPSLNHQIGVVGHGRFGDALCTLLENGGFDVAAWDPVAPIPAHRQFGGLHDVVAGARFVVLAVPVPAFRETLEKIRPLLNRQQIVADVGSVKVGPEAAMRDVLGDDIPWVATHPLFGPNSLARGERPLRVVVCPNPQHRAANRSVRGLLRRLECTVIAQEAVAHDQAMAEAHALGFFIAKGLLDVGASLESEVVPPSARGLQRLISAVRVDAGHLVGILNRENPFASALRKDFLASLTALDEALDQGDVVLEDAPLAAPDLSARSPALQQVRDHIDDLDRELVDLLARRARLARKARDAKAEMGAEVRDPLREARLREDRRRWAQEHGLDPDGIDGIFGAILRASRAVQLAAPVEEDDG